MRLYVNHTAASSLYTSYTTHNFDFRFLMLLDGSFGCHFTLSYFIYFPYKNSLTWKSIPVFYHDLFGLLLFSLHRIQDPIKPFSNVIF